MTNTPESQTTMQAASAPQSNAESLGGENPRPAPILATPDYRALNDALMQGMLRSRIPFSHFENVLIAIGLFLLIVGVPCSIAFFIWCLLMRLQHG